MGKQGNRAKDRVTFREKDSPGNLYGCYQTAHPSCSRNIVAFNRGPLCQPGKVCSFRAEAEAMKTGMNGSENC